MSDCVAILKADVSVALLEALKACEARGMNRETIAKRAGLAHLRHVLGGKENLLLSTIARAANAMGLRPRLVFERHAGLPAKLKSATPGVPAPPTIHTIHAVISAATLPELRRNAERRLRASSAKQLLHALVDIGEEWVSRETIAARAGINETVIREGMAALERAGLIRIECRGLQGLPRTAPRRRYFINHERLRALKAQ